MLILSAYKAASLLNGWKDKRADEKRRSMHQPASRSSRQGKGHVTTLPSMQTNVNPVSGTLVVQEVAKAQGKATHTVKFTKQKKCIASNFWRDATLNTCVLQAIRVKFVTLVNLVINNESYFLLRKQNRNQHIHARPWLYI